MKAKLLIADPKGRVVEHPYLLATLRSGHDLVPAQDRPIALPSDAKLAHLPGRLPVGVNPDTGEFELVREFYLEGKRIVPQAVGALLPPGYTRTYLPGEVKGDGPILPQWAYTAAAWLNGRAVTWALRTDRRAHWSTHDHSTPDLKKKVRDHMKRLPNNRVLEQLKTCALVYRCFTSQNVYYCRDEGAIPASTFCNARCVGCISDQPEGSAPASHARIDEGPVAQEMAAMAVHHLVHARGRAMVSFGQGCEGEPLTRYKVIAQAIRLIRQQTARGSININTNGSLTHALGALFDSGLDAVRVSLNSAHPELYAAYYKPQKYSWHDVEASIALAREKKGYVALNLLLFPGVTDRQGEIDALVKLIRAHRVDQVQTRSLAIDPLQYLEVADGRGAGGKALGVRAMLKRLKEKAPWLVIGNFARGLAERGAKKSPQK
ncbi:MAG: radical SAM protein [Myxococcaceae bacterium]|nr:radical SAM protein [Myxococcaceae bacterium]